MRPTTPRHTRSLLIVSALSLGGSCAAKPEAPPAKKAYLFYQFTENPDECGAEQVDLERHVGPDATDRKKIVLSFVQWDCEVCKKEMKALSANGSARIEALKRLGAELWVVVVDAPKPRKQMVELLTEYGIQAPIIADPIGVIAAEYGVKVTEELPDGKEKTTERFPSTIVVDPDGRVDFSEHGYTDATYSRLKAALQSKKN